ncbi:hypothetical protein EVAR_23326_1 [Eumeta japonica]|uniref:Uncharacterized protein n=1 Tax=Eumeta variegata TaxID=151549 RepID=A0A4C1Y193_EUMVA|nr:hypothetical protein EVAR_23326_1 [Eumeta japonica]
MFSLSFPFLSTRLVDNAVTSPVSFRDTRAAAGAGHYVRPARARRRGDCNPIIEYVGSKSGKHRVYPKPKVKSRSALKPDRNCTGAENKIEALRPALGPRARGSDFCHQCDNKLRDKRTNSLTLGRSSLFGLN